MSDEQTLPVGIWDNPRKGDQQAYEEFVLAWFADDAQVREFYEQLEDENDIALRSLAYQCNTRGTNLKTGSSINVQITNWLDDGAWSETANGWFGHKECTGEFGEGLTHTWPRFGCYHIYAANEQLELPPSETLTAQDDTWVHCDSGFFAFRDIFFRKKVIIDYACVLFKVYDAWGDSFYINISGDPSCSAPVREWDEWRDVIATNIDPPPLETYSFSQTNNRVMWAEEDFNPWSTDWTAETPNIACVIQEIADLQGQGVHDVILFFISRTDYRTGHMLHVRDAAEYEEISGIPTCGDSGQGAILQIWYHLDYDMEGGLVAGGEADQWVEGVYDYEMSGGVALNGTARNTEYAKNIGQGGIAVDGHGTPWWTFDYSATGGVYLEQADIELWLPFDVASDSTANDISLRERHARMRNMYSFQYVTGRIGTKAIRMGDVIPSYTIRPSGGIAIAGESVVVEVP